jgi:hypothetical protein
MVESREFNNREQIRCVVKIGTPPPPSHPQAKVPPPFGSVETHSLAGEGVGGGSPFGRDDRHCGTLGTIHVVLCGIFKLKLKTYA